MITFNKKKIKAICDIEFSDEEVQHAGHSELVLQKVAKSSKKLKNQEDANGLVK